MTADLRNHLEALNKLSPREFVKITDSLSGDYELAAITTEFERHLRAPVIEYTNVLDSTMTVVHNVCASVGRIAKSVGWSQVELEERLANAYDNLVDPVEISTGPVNENRFDGDCVDLNLLPNIRYTESETHPYISAAILVAKDIETGTLNLSFHRLMKIDSRSCGIYMTPNGHLNQIFNYHSKRGIPTPIAGFIGWHPLWALGALAAGSMQLDEMCVIGGLLGEPLPVVSAKNHPQLKIPAFAEIGFEGEILCDLETPEGPYGEAFGFVSERAIRPVLRVDSLCHRNNALYQDIVPGRMEHLTMTGTAASVCLRRSLLSEYEDIVGIYLPVPMTAYLSLKPGHSLGSCTKHSIVKSVLKSQRYLKHVVLFDSDVNINNSSQTQRAISMNVQADKDLILLEEQCGNGLDPSEVDGLTTKWGLDATMRTDRKVTRNQIPEETLSRLDIKSIMKRAMTG